MTTQEVFINKNYQMRAGWRVLIFIVAFILISMPSVYLGLLFTKFLEFPKEYNEIIVKFLTTIIPLGLSFFLLKKLDNRSTDYLGLKTDRAGFIELAWGLLIGFVMLTIAVLIPYAMGYVTLQFAAEPPSYFFSGLAFNLLLFIVVGFNEEILFRGYIFQATGEGLGFISATLLYSLLFGAAHLGNPNVSVFGIINIVLAGVLLSLAYIKTRALWMPIGIHIAWNFTQGYIWGLPVSGTTVIQPMIIAQEIGPDEITGGSFGPEGGIMCSIVCIGACLLIWKYFSPSDAMKQVIQEAEAAQPFKPDISKSASNTNPDSEVS